MLYPQLSETLVQARSIMDAIPDARKALLESIAAKLTAYIQKGNTPQLVCICTENSRRSHIAHFMAAATAHHFQIPVATFSGGTKETACNPRTIAALRRAGFNIQQGAGENPRYAVQWSAETPPSLAYSKLYDAPENPQADFFAIMVCGHADANCPFIPTALERFAITFTDPKIADDTPEETAVYDAKVLEIGSQFYYLFQNITK
jgi:arsenate reductase